MGSTAKPDVEELQFKLGELPPGTTAEHFRPGVIAPAQGFVTAADGALAYRRPHAGLHGWNSRGLQRVPRGAGWRTSGKELPDGYFGLSQIMNTSAGENSPIGTQGRSPRALAQCA
jgi:hypothetical protein